MATRLQPYLFFYGRCREALDFYKSVFDGDYQPMVVRDSPVAEHMPHGFEDKIMHASFTAGDVAFFASDGREIKEIDPNAGNVAMALNYEDGALAERVFARLSEGGDVRMPIAPAFWGGRFGNVVDKFGTEWVMTLP